MVDRNYEREARPELSGVLITRGVGTLKYRLLVIVKCVILTLGQGYSYVYI